MTATRRASWMTPDGATLAPCRRSDIVLEVLPDEAILIDPVNRRTHRVSMAALAVWQMCDGKTAVSHMAACMTETWDVHLDDALEEVAQFIIAFARRDLLELSKQPDRVSSGCTTRAHASRLC